MKKTFHIFLLAAASLFVSCQQSEIYSPDTSVETTGNYIPGKAYVKVSPDLGSRIEAGESVEMMIPGATMQRVFSHGGRYEERMCKAGLHLWYNVEFDEAIPVTKAGESLRHIDGVDLVEYVPVMSIAADYPFDDPNLKKQWHYSNAGNPLTGLKAGCDVNISPAWERGVVGDSRVVVAVIDGGVDLKHPDLQDNIWQGRDEKGNLIHGYDSVYGTNIIDADDHGTHVAGIIAAVNNNGIGVCGIAGGDAAKGIKGAAIMSCQIFSGEKNGDSAASIVWAANHGAVIAQNSWGFAHDANPDMKDTPKVIKDAIDYFNQFAGCDENGEQLPDSPMKGGVVIFAAGNEGRPMGYPASYSGCLAVSATDGKYKLAYYSNFGDWVDIAAPGGDATKNQLIHSTIKGGAYDGMQGTSMACPHVSGVAALIVSEFGGPGFTREDLIDRLLKTATDISLPADEMGAGMVNASAAVAHYGEDLPNVPVFGRADEVIGTSLKLKYVVPEDNKGVECRKAVLYYSTRPFSEIAGATDSLSLAVKHNPGDTLVFSVNNLELNTTYHFSVKGCDVFGNSSALSENVAVTTKDNFPPVIQALSGADHVLEKHMQVRLKFRVTDPENRLKEVRYENATDSDTMIPESDGYIVSINAQNIPAGTYRSAIIAEDEDGKTAQCDIRFVVKENHAPVIAAEFEDIVFAAVSKSRQIRLSDYISDEDGETPVFTVVSSDEAVVTTSVAKDGLTLNSKGYGEAVITVTAADAMSETVRTSFKVIVRDGSKPYDIYPNPVTDGKLYVRASQADEAGVRIVSSAGAVVYDGNVSVDPFNPAMVDMSGLISGVYSVKVTDKSGKVFTQNVVKL